MIYRTELVREREKLRGERELKAGRAGRREERCHTQELGAPARRIRGWRLGAVFLRTQCSKRRLSTFLEEVAGIGKYTKTVVGE